MLSWCWLNKAHNLSGAQFTQVWNAVWKKSIQTVGRANAKALNCVISFWMLCTKGIEGRARMEAEPAVSKLFLWSRKEMKTFWPGVVTVKRERYQRLSDLFWKYNPRGIMMDWNLGITGIGERMICRFCSEQLSE